MESQAAKGIPQKSNRTAEHIRKQNLKTILQLNISMKLTLSIDRHSSTSNTCVGHSAAFFGLACLPSLAMLLRLSCSSSNLPSCCPVV